LRNITARHICGKAVSRNFARKLVRQFSQQRSFLHIRTLIYYTYVANVSNHTKNCVAFETHIDP